MYFSYLYPSFAALMCTHFTHCLTIEYLCISYLCYSNCSSLKHRLCSYKLMTKFYYVSVL